MLVLPQHIYTDIQDIASEKSGLETGVALFGVRVFKLENPKAICGLLNTHYVVLAVAGPGPRAVHKAARYSADGSYYTAIYWALQSAMPAIEWLGELHVHPAGMPVLSSRDHQNVHEILLGEDDTVHPQEFIAGVMQQRKDGVDIYPYFFSRTFLEGRLMDIKRVGSEAEIVQRARIKSIGGTHARPDVRTEPEGSREACAKTHRHHWPWKFWRHLRRHGGAPRRRQADAR